MPRSGTAGRLVKINKPMKTAATARACGREKIWAMNWPGRFVSCEPRVTSKPAASEIKKAGICVTSPSPIVSRVNSEAAAPRSMP